MPPEDHRELLAPYKREIDRINRALAQPLSSPVPLAEEIARHSLLGEGKRLRPLLFVISARLCGYRGRDTYRLAALFEYIHTASLLHDDVLDNADLRRRKASANRLWGNQAAVLEGDFLYSTALSLAVEAGNLALVKLLTRTTQRMAEGQIQELLNTRNWQIDRETYLEIIDAKTAVLISAACACGAIVAKAGKREEKALAHFGHSAGMAFQMMDDLLDYSSSEKVLGKPAGKDILEGKVTLPLIYAFQEMDMTTRENWMRRLDRRIGANDLKSLVKTVRQSSALQRVRAEAEQAVEQGAEALQVFPPSRLRSGLLALNRYIVERGY